jgi:hypothetical protein
MTAAERTWQANADEFGAIERGEGAWSLAVLVACSVELTAPGRPPVNGERSPFTGKVSAHDFAERAGVDRQTVANYLAGWGRAIEAGAPVPPAADLSPADVGTFPLPARRFNGRGGYVSTRKPSAPKVKVEPEPPKPPTPDDLAGMDREDLRHLVSDALTEAGKRLELEAIANGGTITPVGKPAPAPLPEPIATIAAHDKAWLAVVRAHDKMTAAMDDFAAEWAPFPDGGEVVQRVQKWALDLLTYCDEAEVTA